MRHGMTMTLPKAARKDSYTETEAAQALGISVSHLHQLLDEYIFNDGRRRPPNLEFNGSDLLLFAYWNREWQPSELRPDSKKVVVITRGK